jgi:hypothetical protein
MQESTPPERNVPSGTSETKRFSTAFSTSVLNLAVAESIFKLLFFIEKSACQ